MVSVLVVTYDSGEEIEACLDAALAQEVPGHRVEVVVVDNASSDDSAERVARYGERVTLVRSQENRGYAAGCNTAVAVSCGRIVVLLNPDCVLDPGCLAALVAHLEGNPGVGVAAAVLRYPDGRPQRFARRELSLPDVVWGLTEVGRRIDRGRRNGRGLAHRQYGDLFDTPIDAPVAVDCPAAACVATWGHLVRDGVFNETLPLMFNDADLYRRLRHRGYRAEVVPGATAVHGQGTSLKRVPSPRMRAEFVASMRRYAAGHFGLPRLAALWLLLAVDAVTAGLLSYRGGSAHDRARARTHAKGTLGGLGAPGGAEPWLTPVARMRPRPLRTTRRLVDALPATLQALSRRSRRRLLLVRFRLSAWLVGARVEVTIHPTADVARQVLLEIRPRARARVVIGEGARVMPGVYLRLSGTLLVGPYSEVRPGAGLNVRGTLDLQGRNIVGRGAMVHADLVQVWEWGATIAEYCAVLDSNHDLDGSPVHFYDQPVQAAPVRLEANAFVGAHAVVTAGVTIGAGSVIGANAVATRDIPAGVLAVGSPATPVKDLPDRRQS